MGKKKKGEGLTAHYTEDGQIFGFLEAERKRREEEIRQEERQIKHPPPIVGYTKKMPNIFAPNPEKPKKTLKEIQKEEDREREEWLEDEAERKRRQR